MNKVVFFRISFFAVILLNTQPCNSKGNVFFGATQIHDIRMPINQPSYQGSFVSPSLMNNYITGDLNNRVLLMNFGIKFNGKNSHYNPSQKAKTDCINSESVINHTEFSYSGIFCLELKNSENNSVINRKILKL